MTNVGQAAVSTPSYSHQLAAFCRRASFSPGDVIRRKGDHYRDMYLITEGSVDVILEPNSGPSSTTELGPGSPIGEIGFLRGCRATGTVVARTAASAIIIDDGTLEKIQERDQKLAVEFCKYLASVSEQRLGRSANIASLERDTDQGPEIDVLLCRNDAMLHEAMKLRYSVYCEELGRSSPYADHDKKTIRDQLDDFGHTFIAISSGEAIGTLRGNMSREGSLGMFAELYGMNASSCHPQHTAVCTKFVVKKPKRFGYTSLKLVSVMIQYGMRLDIVECYIDCIPELTPFYEKFGFTVTGEQFFHYESGTCYPMKLDLTAHGRTLCERVSAHTNPI
jgi:CRP-like cAMP-binding protein/predicted GNAT family N-acyltransferase